MQRSYTSGALFLCGDKYVLSIKMNAMFCDACQIPCNGPKQWTAHLASKGHAKKSGRSSLTASFASPGLSSAFGSPASLPVTPVTSNITPEKKVTLSESPFGCSACPYLRFDTGAAMRKHLLSVEHARNKMALNRSSSPTIINRGSFSAGQLSPIPPLGPVMNLSPASPMFPSPPVTPARPSTQCLASASPVLCSTFRSPSLYSDSLTYSFSKNLSSSDSLTSNCDARNRMYPDEHSAICGYSYVDEFRSFHVSEKIHNLSSHFYFVLKDEDIPNLGM